MWFSTYAMLFDLVESLNITFDKVQEINSMMIWVISYDSYHMTLYDIALYEMADVNQNLI